MMMIKGIGLDIVELHRIKDMIDRQPKFPGRILTETERESFESLSDRRKVEFLSGRFAAKEAFAKAVGTGIGKELSFRDIEIEKDERGKPHIVKPAGLKVHLSITHSRDFAAAQVVLED